MVHGISNRSSASNSGRGPRSAVRTPKCHRGMPAKARRPSSSDRRLEACAGYARKIGSQRCGRSFRLNAARPSKLNNGRDAVASSATTWPVANGASVAHRTGIASARTRHRPAIRPCRSVRQITQRCSDNQPLARDRRATTPTTTPPARQQHAAALDQAQRRHSTRKSWVASGARPASADDRLHLRCNRTRPPSVAAPTAPDARGEGPSTLFAERPMRACASLPVIRLFAQTHPPKRRRWRENALRREEADARHRAEPPHESLGHGDRIGARSDSSRQPRRAVSAYATMPRSPSNQCQSPGLNTWNAVAVRPKRSTRSRARASSRA
jgi:hypothetical protein